MEPSGPSNMSNRMSRAGVSIDRRRMRLAAGCSRACKASKVSRPLSSMTSSPSTTNRSNGASSRVATTSGKKRRKDLPDFPLSSTAPPSLKARQRKPSHFGSNCHRPGSPGRVPPTSPPLARCQAAEQRLPQVSPSVVCREFIFASPQAARSSPDPPTSGRSLGSNRTSGQNSPAEKIILLLRNIFSGANVECPWSIGTWKPSDRLCPILWPRPGSRFARLEARSIPYRFSVRFGGREFGVRSTARGAPAMDLVAGLFGWLVLSLAFISPLCNLSVALFSARGDPAYGDHAGRGAAHRASNASRLRIEAMARVQFFRVDQRACLRGNLLDLA